MRNGGINLKNINKNMITGKLKFSKHAIKKDSNMRIFLSVLTLLIIFLIGSILPKSAKADNKGKYLNYFYVNVINNVLPITKSPNTQEQYTNSKNDMGSAALSFLGVDISNPISIVTKEIAYLNENEVSTDVNNERSEEAFSINPFNLNDKQIMKVEAEKPNVVAKLYNPDLKKVLNNAKKVLIYHSHTTEAYLASNNDTSKNYFNMDLTRGVCAVGDVIANDLEKIYGVSVIHDETLHNVGDYNASYKKSGVTLDKYLKQYGDFNLIIDLHRDGVNNNYVPKTKINGEEVSKFMFVVTRKNPRYSKQKKLVDSMVGISNKLFPNILDSREIYYHDWGMSGFYNQNRSDNAIMIEVGNQNNTIEQSKNTGKYLSRIIAEQLNGKK